MEKNKSSLACLRNTGSYFAGRTVCSTRDTPCSCSSVGHFASVMLAYARSPAFSAVALPLVWMPASRGEWLAGRLRSSLGTRSRVFSLPVRLGIACLDVGASSRCRQFSLCLMWHSPQSLWLSTGHPAGGVHADVHLTIQKFSNPINGLGSAAIRRAGLNGRARRAIDERGGEGQQSDLGGTSSPARVRRHASSPGSYVQDESRVRGQCQRDVTHVT